MSVELEVAKALHISTELAGSHGDYARGPMEVAMQEYIIASEKALQGSARFIDDIVTAIRAAEQRFISSTLGIVQVLERACLQ